jgi:hypothetical protein
MCWNASISLNTFLVGVFGVALGAFNGYSLFTLLFFMSFILMQLVEYFMWNHLDDPVKNYWISVAAQGVLAAQPVASILRIYPTDPTVSLQMLAAYAVLGGLTKIWADWDAPAVAADKMRMYVGRNGHLVWNWLSKKHLNAASLLVYFVFLLAPLFYLREWLGLAFALLTLGAAIWTYSAYETWGSMWCWFINVLVLGLIGKIVFYDEVCWAVGPAKR